MSVVLRVPAEMLLESIPWIPEMTCFAVTLGGPESTTVLHVMRDPSVVPVFTDELASEDDEVADGEVATLTVAGLLPPHAASASTAPARIMRLMSSSPLYSSLG